MRQIKPSMAHGFTLIEVLIALLIFGLGVVGVTALTTQSQRITHQAYQSMTATWQLHDIMELIRANASEARGSSSYIRAYDADIPAVPSCITNDTDCSPTLMAQYDLNQWLTTVSQELPTGSGAIALASNSYTLTVHWDGNRVGAGATNNCPNTVDTDLMCQQLQFDL
ncbi:MAG: type IV pilus modification protein PilV [Halopseudomonas sp.]